MNSRQALRVLRELDDPQPDPVPPDVVARQIQDALFSDGGHPVAVDVTRGVRGRRPPRRTRWLLSGIVAAATVAAVAVAAVVVTEVRHNSTPTTTSPSSALSDAARALLSSWTASHAGVGSPELIVTGDLVTLLGDWTGDAADADKQAFVNGQIDVAPGVVASGTLPADVTWQDGTTASAVALSPQAALAQAVTRAAGDAGTVPLIVTSATASSSTVDTTRGPATVPTWVLTLQATPVRIAVVATTADKRDLLDPQTPSRTVAQVGQDTVSIDAVTLSPNGRTVTASFVGATHDASMPCGEDYTAYVVADARAVVIIVQRHSYAEVHPDAADIPNACRLPGTSRMATAQLDNPLAGRPILDLNTGQPVTLH